MYNVYTHANRSTDIICLLYRAIGERKTTKALQDVQKFLLHIHPCLV